MRILCWNLQKKDLAKWSLETFNPDVALFQEFWERENPIFSLVGRYFPLLTQSYLKKDYACGTAAMSTKTYTDFRNVVTTQKEFFISMKKTACAVKVDDVWCMSVHAYNGWPFKSVKKLKECVREFIETLPRNEPAVVAGDFNTWSPEHLEELDILFIKFGFRRAVSIAYDKKKTLDHVYVRGRQAKLLTSGFDKSDHPYFLFELY